MHAPTASIAFSGGQLRDSTGYPAVVSGGTGRKVRQPMKLDSGDMFPELSLSDLEDEQVTIPDVFGDGWGVVLVYRGHW